MEKTFLILHYLKEPEYAGNTPKKFDGYNQVNIFMFKTFQDQN